jgi:hypothetical protein
VALGLMIVVLCACAPKQLIPLDVLPQPATLYLDGEALDSIPPELELRADRPHVLFFKSEGYRPERVVLESREVEGKSRLAPAMVQVRLRPAGPGRSDLTIEFDELSQEDR